MSRASVRRRDLLLAGAGAALAGGLPALAMAATRPAGGILLYDAAMPEAKALTLALRAPGQALVALDGDPMRIWRDRLADSAAPIGGVTRWSDFVLLSELARERRLRVREEGRQPTWRGPLLVRWSMAERAA